MEFTDSWAKPLEEQYKHLFDQNENGKILRGIECGKGWEKHVIKLLEDLQFHYDRNKIHTKIFQIKEKFGDARVYFSCNKENSRFMIDEVVGRFEGKCEITCQTCGKLQYNCIRPSKSGWIHCKCDECFEAKYDKPTS
jgi:hypothetical protein